MTIDSSPHPIRILLVDDEPGDAHLMEIALRESPYPTRLQHVVDGVDALRMLRREGEFSEEPLPDLALIDINMPRMDGHELLEILRNDPQLATLPTVVITTSVARRDIERAYRLGARGYIAKPIDYNQLVESINGLLHYWIDLCHRPHETTPS
jgi:CheY-like chemotaxis protein